jgi:hypothetical protein
MKNHIDFFSNRELLYGGTTGWTFLNAGYFDFDDLALRDFDGNGQTDVFPGNGAPWQVAWNGSAAPINYTTSGTTVASLSFGDFNRDNKTDVIGINGGNLSVSLGANSSWQTLNTDNFSLDGFAYGEF